MGGGGMMGVYIYYIMQAHTRSHTRSRLSHAKRSFRHRRHHHFQHTTNQKNTR